MKAKLNTHLLSTLPRVLRMTHNEVADASGISIACWYRLAKDPGKITVQQLIGLANGLHVPVSRFFSFDCADEISVREDYIVTDGYQNCYYDSEAVQRKVGRGQATSWREAASAVGMHWTNVSSSLLAVSRTPVTRLLELCEAFSFDLFEFLVDPNRDCQKRHGVRPKQSDAGNDALRDEIAALNRKINDLTTTVNDLSGRYKALIDRHSRLENMVREYLGTSLPVAADEKHA